MSFRAIRPFPTPQRADDVSDSRDHKRPNIERTKTACEACRKLKAKCDGTRPRCQACVAKDRECVFRGEEGQSTQAILTARIEELEKRIRELQPGQVSHPAPDESEGSREPTAVGHIVQQACASIVLAIPSATATKRAIDGFFSCSGKLFHVFSQNQVASLVDSVYGEVDGQSKDLKADIGSLMAVAAVGSQYANTVEEDAEVGETFYNIAKFYLEDVITQRPLEAIKVCTLLCMYNVFSKTTVSLAYSDAGLGICDRYGLHCQRRQLDGITDSAWLEYRKAWRTLVFLSAWLSVTLGYKTGNDQVLQRVALSCQLQVEVDDQHSISEVVQTEMTKIAVLKAKILHMHLAFKYLATEPLNSIIRDLQAWYEQLPPQMKLQSEPEHDVPLEAKRSICHVHLLYLGAIMLLFRRIVAENTRVGRPDISLPILRHPSSDLLSKQGPNALIAANTSAKILKLMLDENSIFQRCWLIIFQSYTSCIIIMHSVLKNLISSWVPSHRDETKNARSCLETLAYCGLADPVASRFHKKAQAIYNSVLGHIESYEEAIGKSRSKPAEASASRDGPEDISMQDNTHDPEVLSPSYRRSIEELSSDLLVMLCRPFGDPSYRDGAKESLAETNKSDPTRYEHSVLLERLDWDYENSVPFHWDSERLGLGKGGDLMSRDGPSRNTQSGNRFLDSMHPSGWS
ncbi:hypothetical protein F5Y03DRAFT_361226 [Xylaria venustula]|nr:hypothetical protein F5Y03DRAFT_361226 [Xylaria venustula]